MKPQASTKVTLLWELEPFEELLWWSAPSSGCWLLQLLQWCSWWSSRLSVCERRMERAKPLTLLVSTRFSTFSSINIPQNVASLWLISRDGKILILTLLPTLQYFMAVWIYRGPHYPIPEFLPDWTLLLQTGVR